MSIDRMAATTNDVVDDVALMAARAGIGRHDENDGGNVIIWGLAVNGARRGSQRLPRGDSQTQGMCCKSGKGGDGDKRLHAMHAEQPQGSAADSAALCPIKGRVARGQGQEGEGLPHQEAGRGGGAPTGGGEEDGREGEEEGPIRQGLMADSQQQQRQQKG